MRSILILLTGILLCSLGQAQERYFTDAVEIISKKKPAYITTIDGDEVEGKIKNIKLQRGLVKEVKLKMEDGEVKSFLPADVKHMYLPQSSWDKMLEASKMDVTSWGEDDVNQDKLKEGYAFFESVDVIINKKKEGRLILQLVNPAFRNKYSVYFDPFAQETISAGVGGVKLAGGIDKSYYFKSNDEKAYKLKKKDYKDLAADLYSDCDSFWKTIKDDVRWSDFPEHLFNYTNNCSSGPE
jgi:hypothetical protein